MNVATVAHGEVVAELVKGVCCTQRVFVGEGLRKKVSRG